MLRYAMVLFVVLVGIALLSGNPRTRRVLWVLAGLAILYTSSSSPASSTPWRRTGAGVF